MNYIGIDPGKSGGMAVIESNGEVFAWPFKNETECGIWEIIYDNSCQRVVAMLEQVHAMPKQGVSSSFNFGMSYGALRMALIAAEIPFETVTPGKWQRVLGCLSKGDKNVTKAKAQELFPSVKVTHAVADALLLAEYCRRTWKV